MARNVGAMLKLDESLLDLVEKGTDPNHRDHNMCTVRMKIPPETGEDAVFVFARGEACEKVQEYLSYEDPVRDLGRFDLTGRSPRAARRCGFS